MSATGHLRGLVQPVEAGRRYYPAVDSQLEPEVMWDEIFTEELKIRISGQPYRSFVGMTLASPGESVEEYHARVARERERE